MNNLKHQIDELKNEVTEADLTNKLNALRNLVADEMDRLTCYKEKLIANGEKMKAYYINEQLQHNYILLSVINSIFTDVEFMNDEVMTHYKNAIKEIEKASSDMNSLATKSDNA